MWECAKISVLQLMTLKKKAALEKTLNLFVSFFFTLFFSFFVQAKALLVICAWLHACHVNVCECTL